MKKTFICAGLLLLSSFGLMAQTSRTGYFLAVMQPSNEVPALTDTSSANAIIWVHGVFNQAGIPTSGSIDFDISTKFSSAVTVTGLHIHNAAAGVNGAIVIPTDVNSTDKSIAIDSTGRLRIQKQVQIPSTTPPIALSTVVDMLQNPQNYYVNIHTTVNPGGAMRGQLLPADATVLMGLMSPKNEVPPVPVNGSGVASVLLLRGRDASGAVAAATALFNVDYTGFDAAAGTSFTGLHIHSQTAGNNGSVVINTGIGSGAASVPIDPSGSGNLNYVVNMSPLDASWATPGINGELNTVNSLFTNPANQYINAHTNVFGGGVMRDQMRRTEEGRFDVTMLASNEVPPIAGLTATAPTEIPTFVLRNADGSVAAGAVIFDVNYRGFAPGATITGLHIHEGAPGANGGIVIPSGVDANANKVVTDTGDGNIFRLVNVSTPTGVAALNRLVQNPNNFYVNLHTNSNPGGAIRAPLAAPLGKPAVGGVAANASAITTVAPGEVASIYGTNLSPIGAGLTGFGDVSELTTNLSGVSVTVGGVKAPLYAVFPNQINIQVPFEVAAGPQPVIVTNAGGVSTSFNVTVAPLAPSIFDLDGKGLASIVKNADFSLVTSANPAKAGDVLVIYMTGLGQTTPAVQTGALVVPPAGAFNNTAPVTVTIGGVTAPVAYSIASPSFAGLYQVAVTVPAGVSGAAMPVVVTSGTARSNSLSIPVQ